MTDPRLLFMAAVARHPHDHAVLQPVLRTGCWRCHYEVPASLIVCGNCGLPVRR